MAGGVAFALAVAVSAGWPGIAAATAAALTAGLLLAFFRSWLGGVTGDCLGATAKLCETAALVAYLAAH
jgi:cobalamin synthase